jgi:hypothetical protein
MKRLSKRMLHSMRHRSLRGCQILFPQSCNIAMLPCLLVGTAFVHVVVNNEGGKLGFVSTHRDGRKVFHPSDMQLGVLSNASYLSRPNAGNVAASFQNLCRLRDPGFLNESISVHSAGIPIVCSSVHEAEYAGTFGAAKTSATPNGQP